MTVDRLRPRFLGHRFVVRPWLPLALATLSLALPALVARSAWADVDGPTPTDRQVAVAVATMLNKEHLSRHPLNDEISQRWITMFLKNVDPMKLYFTQADINRFMQQQNNLDDQLLRGDVTFAFDVFKTYLVRLEERVKVIDELLKMEHDFTADETLNVDFDKRPWATDDADLRERWRKRIKYDLLVMKAGKTKPAEAREKLTKRYHSFARNMHQISHEDLLEMYLTALTTCYDPHTSYMSASSLENFDIMMRGELEGIGAALQTEDGSTVVSKVIQGGAAEKDGKLKPKDQIIGVGQGENGPIVDVVAMRLNDVVKLIRGPRGTVVRLQVQVGGKGVPKIYNITRQSIELTDSLARSEIVNVGSRPDGQPYKIGVIDLPSFYMDMEAARLGKADFRSTTRDVKKLLDQFRDKGVDAVVLDLRRNGGGALTEAINLTGLFIDTGPVVQVKDADGRVQHYDDMDAGVAWDGPLIVLDSKFSASASEIFSGAIQDYHRGLVVGDHQSHGKGTVQSMLNIGRQLFRAGDNAPNWGALKITMQQFYRPNGDSTQNRGVVSDVELPSITSHLDVGEKDLEYALKFDRVQAAPFKVMTTVEQPLITELNRRSHARCEASPEFKKVESRIVHYREQKDRKTVALNETKFMADRSDLNAEEEDAKQLDDPDGKERPVVEKTPYFNEALAVVVDYIDLLHKGKVAVTKP
ncbi:MAG: carboxy terminal-processing peptidase [Planctomycetia bacterium]|nr:carboxy terminal-processing peptidase [Planctomycetia bacterium]